MPDTYRNFILYSILLLCLYLTSIYSYLLFHSLAEIFSVIVACGIFMIAWNSRRFLDNNYLLFIGIAYLFVGILDLLHTLSYKGMGVFPGYDANLPTQLWISARYLESISILIGPFLFGRRLRPSLLFFSYIAITVVLIASIFVWKIFPDCFIEGSGLTLFKKTSEYIISAILAAAIFFLYRKRGHFDPGVLRLLIASISVTIMSELFFTFYISVYGLSNLAGHFLKIVSFSLIYKAFIVTGLQNPYALLFRNLKKSEEDLKNALLEVRKLSGFLPICSSCKKIRDDRGYWNQIEEYITQHSDVDFSHSICPDCAKKLYPDFFKEDD